MRIQSAVIYLLLGLFCPAAVRAVSLDLQVWDPGQTAQEYKLAARITNRSSQPVSLNRLSVRAWFRYTGSSALAPASYGNNQTIYNAQGQWVANVDATEVSIQTVSPALNCGSNREANRVVVIRFTDASSKSIPPGGWVECNSPTNPLGTWHKADWSSFDRSRDYSRITEAGSSSANRTDLSRFGLYLDGQLACEAKANGADPNSGQAPCGLSACPTPTPTATRTRTATRTFTLTPTPTRTPSPTPTATPDHRLFYAVSLPPDLPEAQLPPAIGTPVLVQLNQGLVNAGGMVGQLMLANILGQDYQLRIDSVGIQGPQQFTWRGRIEGQPAAQFVLGASRGMVSASFFIPSMGYVRLSPVRASDALYWLTRLDPNVPGHAEPEDLAGIGAQPAGAASSSQAVQALAAQALSSAALYPLPGSDGCDPWNIDVLIFYTAQARQLADPVDGLPDNIQARIIEDVGWVNTILNNSQVPAEVTLVGMGETQYDEAVPLVGTTLQRFVVRDDGVMDEIHGLRDSLGADLVSLYGRNGYDVVGGLGGTMSQLSAGEEGRAFSVITFDAGPVVLAHEFGHNMGCLHRRGQSGAGGSTFNYNFAHDFIDGNGNGQNTVMDSSGNGIPYFSNPDVLLLGVPTGRRGPHPQSADNARLLRITIPNFIHKFRPSVATCGTYNPTPTPTPGPAFGWAESMPVYVQETSAGGFGGLLSDQTVQLTDGVSGAVDLAGLITAGRLQSDGADIRIFDDQGQPVFFDLVTNPLNLNAILRIRVLDLFPDQQKRYRMDFGNPSASFPAGYGSTAWLERVYTIADSFEGTALDAAKWSLSQGSASVSGGQLSLPFPFVLQGNVTLQTSSGARLEFIGNGGENGPLTDGSFSYGFFQTNGMERFMASRYDGFAPPSGGLSVFLDQGSLFTAGPFGPFPASPSAGDPPFYGPVDNKWALDKGGLWTGRVLKDFGDPFNGGQDFGYSGSFNINQSALNTRGFLRFEGQGGSHTATFSRVVAYEKREKIPEALVDLPSTPLPVCLNEDWSSYPEGTGLLELGSNSWTFRGSPNCFVGPGTVVASTRSSFVGTYELARFGRPLELRSQIGCPPYTNVNFRFSGPFGGGYSVSFQQDPDLGSEPFVFTKRLLLQVIGQPSSVQEINISDWLTGELDDVRILISQTTIHVYLNGVLAGSMANADYDQFSLEIGAGSIVGAFIGPVEVRSNTCIAVTPTPTPQAPPQVCFSENWGSLAEGSDLNGLNAPPWAFTGGPNAHVQSQTLRAEPGSSLSAVNSELSFTRPAVFNGVLLCPEGAQASIVFSAAEGSYTASFSQTAIPDTDPVQWQQQLVLSKQGGTPVIPLTFDLNGLLLGQGDSIRLELTTSGLAASVNGSFAGFLADTELDAFGLQLNAAAAGTVSAGFGSFWIESYDCGIAPGFSGAGIAAAGHAKAEKPGSGPRWTSPGRELLVAPNPAHQSAKAALWMQKPGTYQLLLFDMTGTQVWASPHQTVGSGEQLVEVPTKVLAPGIYFLVASVDEGLGPKVQQRFKLAVVH